MAILSEDGDKLGSDEAAASDNDDLHIRAPAVARRRAVDVTAQWPQIGRKALQRSWITLGFALDIRPSDPLSRLVSADKGRAAIGDPRGLPCYQWLAGTEQSQPGRLGAAPGTMEAPSRAFPVR